MTLAVVSLARMRHATPLDADTATRVLSEAFSVDPLMGCLWPDADRPGMPDPVALREFMAAAFEAYIPHGHTYVIDGQAAALWAPPGVEPDTSAFAEIFVAYADPDSFESSRANFAAMHELHPEDPHFYLAQIGAADTARGQGLGSILLDRVLSVCDSDGFHAHLEATTPRSQALYTRHGFETLTEIQFAPGVSLYPMTRTPR